MSTKDAVLVTGATGGLGKNTALELVRRGRPVLIGGRRPGAVDQVCALANAVAPGSAMPFVADLAKLDSVRRALDGLGKRPLHGLVANAGLSSPKDLRTGDGFEMTFGVNVLAHQLLLCRLAGQLQEGARVVVVSSGVHEPDHKLARRFGVPAPRGVGARSLALPDQATAADRLADGRQRYSTSKLGNVLQARGLQARLRRSGKDIDVFAIDPGLMVDTELGRDMPASVVFLARLIGRVATPFVDNMRLSTASAKHIASLIEDPHWHGKGFVYLDGDRVKSPSPDALRDDLVGELWQGASELVKLSAEETVLPLS